MGQEKDLPLLCMAGSSPPTKKKGFMAFFNLNLYIQKTPHLDSEMLNVCGSITVSYASPVARTSVVNAI